MTYMVPFDGSRLSEAALAKARTYALALETAPSTTGDGFLDERPVDVVAVSVVPESARYAREMGWIDEAEEFRSRVVVERLHGDVSELDPSAEFRFERVDRAATAGTISAHLRRQARELEADVIFIGSENAGSIVTPIASVGGGVAAERDYDVHLVRHPLPPEKRRQLKSEVSGR